MTTGNHIEDVSRTPENQFRAWTLCGISVAREALSLVKCRACEKISSLADQLARYGNPWTIQIWSHAGAGHWQDFCWNAPQPLAECEKRVEELRKEHASAKFQVVPWLNASHVQETVRPLLNQIAALTRERDEARESLRNLSVQADESADAEFGCEFAHVQGLLKVAEEKLSAVRTALQYIDHDEMCCYPNGPAEFNRCNCARGRALAILDAEQPKTRDDRQKQVADRCAAAFGADHAASIPQRGIRHAEEAIEAAQSAGCDPAMLHKLVDYIYSKPAGKLSQEIGGSGLTLLALAQAAGVSADAEEVCEVERVLAKPLEHFAARNKVKNDAGFNVGWQQPVRPAGDAEETKDAAL